MSSRLATKIKPKHGFAYFLHFALNILLPLLLYVLVRIEFIQLAFIVVLLSKWRMFAVRPRHWLANIRANAVDMVVGASVVIFMAGTATTLTQLIWAGAYCFWLIILKPASNPFWVALQAFVGQFVGLMALFTQLGDAPIMTLVLGAWLICNSAARHFFTSFDEPHTRFLTYTWAYFAAALVWVLGHWLLYYGAVAQPTLLLSVIGYGLASLYYLYETDRLSSLVRRQIVFIMVAIVVVVIAFSDWSDKAI